MKNYRLKKEAVQFFDEKHSTVIRPYQYWENMGLDVKALEEVEDAYISYGHHTKNKSEGGGEYETASLAGWGGDKGSEFHFTIHFPSSKYKEHDEFSKGKTLRSLMDKIQSDINYFMQGFYESK